FARPVALALLPALGGLLVALIGRYVAAEAQGGGIPQVMEAVALRGGRIRPRVSLAKTVASALTLGSGGSAGTEGPIAQIGSAIGSTVGQVFRLSDDRVRNLVACGAAGGIAATFNAPIAGVLFSLEVILGEFSVGYLGTVVVSSVTAAAVSALLLGSQPAFAVPAYALASPMELPLFALLGLLAAPLAVAFSLLLDRTTSLFDRPRWPSVLRPAIGGLGAGICGLAAPAVLGVGYEGIEAALTGQLGFSAMLLLLVAKLVATLLTLGSGGSGGIFAPSLFMGAMLGGLFGLAAQALWPGAMAPVGAYSLVGMSAVFSGAARTPVMAVVMVFEMTGDYRLILPLMLATILSTLVSERLCEDSIYALSLARRGVRLRRGRDVDVLEGIAVREAMRPLTRVAHPDWTLPLLWKQLLSSHQHGLPVLSSDGRLLGIVTAMDLEAADGRAERDSLTAMDLATRDVLVAHPDEPVSEALRRMGARGVGQLPVVDDGGRVVGLLGREDIVRAYNLALRRRRELARDAAAPPLRQMPGTVVVRREVAEGSRAAGRTVAELCLPEGCVLVQVVRGGTALIPRGSLRLQVGDEVTALSRPESLQALERALDNGPG
ncbi:MAG: chloride channel protein, partial [Anaerolineae bacterium]